MLSKVNDIHQVMRSRLFERLWPGTGVCFDLYQTADAGPTLLGDLFHQDGDFLLVEVVIDVVRKAGPGNASPNRVWGGLEITYYSKDRLDSVGAMRRLEEAGDWFAEETFDGVRFREFIPTGNGRDRGFQWYSATIAFEYETQPKEPS